MLSSLLRSLRYKFPSSETVAPAQFVLCSTLHIVGPKVFERIHTIQPTTSQNYFDPNHIAPTLTHMFLLSNSYHQTTPVNKLNFSEGWDHLEGFSQIHTNITEALSFFFHVPSNFRRKCTSFLKPVLINLNPGVHLTSLLDCSLKLSFIPLLHPIFTTPESATSHTTTRHSFLMCPAPSACGTPPLWPLWCSKFRPCLQLSFVHFLTYWLSSIPI